MDKTRQDKTSYSHLIVEAVEILLARHLMQAEGHLLLRKVMGLHALLEVKLVGDLGLVPKVVLVIDGRVLVLLVLKGRLLLVATKLAPAPPLIVTAVEGRHAVVKITGIATRVPPPVRAVGE